MEQPTTYEINKDEQEKLIEKKITVKFDGFDQTEEVPVSWLEQSETLKVMLRNAQEQQDYLDGDDVQDNPVVLFQPINPTNFKTIKSLLGVIAHNAHATNEVKTARLKEKLNDCAVKDLESLCAIADFLEIQLLIEVISDLYVAHCIKPESLSKEKIESTLKQVNCLSTLLRNNIRDSIASQLHFLQKYTIPVITLADPASASSVYFSPDGSLLACISFETIKVWDRKTGICVQTLTGHNAVISSVCFSPDSRLLASGSDDQTLKLWDVKTGECIQTLTGHGDQVRSVCFSPDGTVLASGSADLTVRLWGIKSYSCTQTMLTRHTHLARSIRFSPDGNSIASVSSDGRITLWDVQTGLCMYAFDTHINMPLPICFSPDGKLVACASNDNMIKIWDTKMGICTRRLIGHSNKVPSVCFSADGAFIISGSYDQTIKIWDNGTGNCIKTLVGHTDTVSSACFSADGTIVASLSVKIIKLWDSRTGDCIHTLTNDADGVRSICFSPKETLLAVGLDDGAIKLWDIGVAQQALKDLNVLQVLLLYALENNRIEISDINTDMYLNSIFELFSLDVKKQYDPHKEFIKVDSHVNQSSSSSTVNMVVNSAAVILPATAYGLYTLGNVACKEKKDNG